MSGSEVTILQQDDAIRIEGLLVLRTVTPVLRDFKAMLSSGNGKTIVDLGGIKRADSAALALMLEGLREARRQGRQLVYRNMPDRLLQLARISDLDELIV